MTKNNLISAGIGFVAILVVLMVVVLMPTKYTVTFDTDGGTIMGEVEVKKGTIIGDLEVPTKEGYTFLHWTLDGKECSKTDEITKDIKLIAKWEKKEEINPEVKKYTVTFDSDGGSTINKAQVEDGKTVEEPNSPTKEGYIFVEWMLDNKTFDFSTEITNDITLVAKWEKAKEEVKTYTVTFNTDGGSKISSKTVVDGNKVSKPSNPTKNGYTFVNWTLDGKNYDFNTKITKNITLKATWKKNEDKPVVEVKKYTVTFEAGPETSIPSQSVEEGKKVSKPSNPTWSGYEFSHWSILPNDSEYDFNNPVNSNITLSAVWKKVDVNFNDDLETAIKKVKSANSLTRKISLQSNKSDESTEAILKLNLTTDESEVIMYFSGTEATHIYTVLEGSKLIDYISMPLFGSDEWFRSDSSSTTSYDDKFHDELLKNIDIFNNDGNNTYTATLGNSASLSLYKSISSDEENNVQFVNGMTVKVVISSKNIDKIILDMSNSIKIDGQLRTKFTMTIDYSNINNTKILVPEEVKNSAITQ